MEIVQASILEAKERIHSEILKDELIMFFTRVVEDLKTKKNPIFYGRIKDFSELLEPYSELGTFKEIAEKFVAHDLHSEFGISLDSDEKKYVKVFSDNLDSEGRLKNASVMKGRLNKILEILVGKYFPNSVEIIEPYILGKLICSVGGVRNLWVKPASTIQLIGAEKALFRHSRSGADSPKYGLLYYSRYVQGAKNKGKEARKLANKLAIAIRQDFVKCIEKEC